MIIKFSEKEKELINSIIKIHVDDPSPCNTKCNDEDRRACGGCEDSLNWYNRNHDTFAKFEELKETYPQINFDHIIQLHINAHKAKIELNKAQGNYDNAVNDLKELSDTIDDFSLAL